MSILWMMDETLTHAKPSHWSAVSQLYTQLVTIIGRSDLTHTLVDPRDCLRSLIKQIPRNSYDAIVDLTGGWLGAILSKALGIQPLLAQFSLSRVRQVSSPRLETTGYLVSPRIPEWDKFGERLSSRQVRVLVVDDVSFSGYTGVCAADLLGIQPDFAYLILNVGDLGKRPGALASLSAKGSRVFTGLEMNTSHGDDGWHLKDLHNHPCLQEAFALSCVLVRHYLDEGITSPSARSILSDCPSLELLFPGLMTSEEVIYNHNRGSFKYSSEQVHNGPASHVSNPLLWTSPYLLEHIDGRSVLRQQGKIISIMEELNQLIVWDREVSEEVVGEFISSL